MIPLPRSAVGLPRCQRAKSGALQLEQRLLPGFVFHGPLIAAKRVTV